MLKTENTKTENLRQELSKYVQTMDEYQLRYFIALAKRLSASKE